MDGPNAAAGDGSPAITPVTGPGSGPGEFTPSNEFQMASRISHEDTKYRFLQNDRDKLQRQQGFQGKQLKVLSAKVDVARGAVGVLLASLATARADAAIAVQLAAEADLEKAAAARHAESALRADQAAFGALSVREADVDAKTAVVTTLAAELAAGREAAVRAVAALEFLSRALDQTVAKMSDAELCVLRSSSYLGQLREQFDGVAAFPGAPMSSRNLGGSGSSFHCVPILSK